MTIEERTLAALGEHKRLREHRLFLAAALEDHFRSIVERAFRRRTLGFLGGIDTGRDVTVDVFTLEPEATKANNHDQVSGHGRSAADQAATRSHGSTQR
jgi:hypothetical protein